MQTPIILQPSNNCDLTIHQLQQQNPAGNAQSQGCLVRIHPLQLENKLVRISQPKTRIGRDAASDIFCNDNSISRNHAVVIRTETGFEIEDQQSTNGTFVDGVLTTRGNLADGCNIQVGNHIFKFLAGESIESQYHETVYSMMTKDGLTGVFNKRYLTDAASHEFDRSSKHNRTYSIVMMDIDFFKKFNDTYGHLAGDEVLQEFARRVQSHCCKDSIFGRFGGEEFAVVLAETDLQTAVDFAEQLREIISSTPFACCVGNLEVTASFGVAQYCGERHETFISIIEEADQHLYKAKQSGRNRVFGE
jgi:diguanylate cyclase (GGDEF)-like protein